jgi:hypothetical protein
MSDAVEDDESEQNQSPRRQIASYISAVDFHIRVAAQSRSRPLPGLILRENNFWVDAAAGKIWFTYEGHLLRIPLPLTLKLK